MKRTPAVSVTATVAALAIWGLAGTAILHLRQVAIAQAEGNLRNLTLALASQTEVTFAGAEMALGQVRHWLEENPDHTLEQARAILERQRPGTPYLRGMSCFDRAGVMLHTTSFPLPPGQVSFADRQWFIDAREDTTRALRVGAPLKSRLDDRWLVPLVLRRVDGSGEFNGTVVGSLNPEFFQDFFKAFDLGEGSAITLQNLDGTVLARHPGNQEAIGKQFPGPMYQEVKRQGEGLIHTRSPIDGRDRIVSARTVGKFPVFVVLSVTQEEALKAWRGQTAIILAAALGLSLLGAFLAHSHRRLRLEAMKTGEAQAETTRHLDSAAALERILRLSLDERELPEVLSSALDQLLAIPWLKVEKRGCIFALNGEDLHLVAERNLPEQLIRLCGKLVAGHCLCGQAARTGRPVFKPQVDGDHAVTYPGMADHGHYCIPIGKASRVVGVLNLYLAPGHERNEDEENFLLMVADTLAGIIERKRAEGRLREAGDLAASLLDASTDAAFLIDPEGILLAANGAMLERFGKRADETIGRNVFDLFPPALAAERRRHLAEALAGRKPLRTIDRRGATTLDNHIYPIVDPRGAVHRIAVFSRDITEQSQAQERIRDALAEAERSNADLQQFAYAASHDLREPLRMINNYLKLLRRKYEGRLDKEADEFIGFAVDGATRMDALIKDLLEYSRVGRIEAALEPVDLQDCVEAALDNLRIAIDDANAVVTVPDDLPVAIGSLNELTRLFQNLIGNAVKYRVPGRTCEVAVEFERRDREWLFSIRDNGIGIAPEHFERVFQVFQRLHARDQYGGTGIGLAVCRKIVERHGGRIWVDSEPAQGSVFRFTLPVVE